MKSGGNGEVRMLLASVVSHDLYSTVTLKEKKRRDANIAANCCLIDDFQVWVETVEIRFLSEFWPTSAFFGPSHLGCHAA